MPIGHVLLAPDKFKGSLTATEVCRHLSRGLLAARPGLDVRSVPVADGGEGTVDAALANGFTAVTATVTGPLGAPVSARIAVRDGTGVVELAQASGLGLSAERDPLRAGSFETGELIRHALDAGCTTIVLGLGGSAGTDGGAGLLQALGAVLSDQRGAPVAPGGAELTRIRRVELGDLDPRLAATTIVGATDVDNPLLGPAGAAAVFGPQKGATESDIGQLEQGLRHWANLIDPTVAERPGAGAAGGVGYAALAVLGATVQPGIELLLELTGFAGQLAGARLVLTGEGSLDAQSLGGKAPIGVARAARAAGVPVVAVVGRNTLTEPEWRAAGFSAVYALQDRQPDLDRCRAEAGPLLEELAESLVADWLF